MLTIQVKMNYNKSVHFFCPHHLQNVNGLIICSIDSTWDNKGGQKVLSFKGTIWFYLSKFLITCPLIQQLNLPYITVHICAVWSPTNTTQDYQHPPKWKTNYLWAFQRHPKTTRLSPSPQGPYSNRARR